MIRLLWWIIYGLAVRGSRCDNQTTAGCAWRRLDGSRWSTARVWIWRLRNKGEVGKKKPVEAWVLLCTSQSCSHVAELVGEEGPSPPADPVSFHFRVYFMSYKWAPSHSFSPRKHQDRVLPPWWLYFKGLCRFSEKTPYTTDLSIVIFSHATTRITLWITGYLCVFCFLSWLAPVLFLTVESTSNTTLTWWDNSLHTTTGRCVFKWIPQFHRCACCKLSLVLVTQMASFPDSDLQTCPLCKELCGSSAPISSSSSTSSSSSHTSSSSSQTNKRLHVLPCLHTFCRQCLEGQRSPGDPLKLRCPTCDQKVSISESGVDSLPSSNFLFSNLLDVVVSSEEQIQNKNGHHHPRGGLGGGTSGFNHPSRGGLLHSHHLGEPQCSSCDEENLATSHCLDCQEYLCDNCVRAHQRVRLTKDHFIERLGENLHLSRVNANSNTSHPGMSVSVAHSLQNNFALLSLFQDRMRYCQQHDSEVSPAQGRKNQQVLEMGVSALKDTFCPWLIFDSFPTKSSFSHTCVHTCTYSVILLFV